MIAANCSVSMSLKSLAMFEISAQALFSWPQGSSEGHGRNQRPERIGVELFPAQLLILRQQPDPLYARVMRPIDHVGHVQKIHVSIAAHERHFLRSLQINLRQPVSKILPAHIVLIDLHRRRLHPSSSKSTWITTVRSGVGSDVRSFGGCGICTFS